MSFPSGDSSTRPRREGLKLAYLEAAEQIPHAIDWYVQAVSSAMGVYGTYKGAKELRALGQTTSLPRLLCVQQESCSPMVRAFEEGSPGIRPEHIVARPEGIAEAILRGNPIGAYPYIREIVLESDGRLVAVSETEIRESRSMIEELEGLSPCFSAAAAFAGLAKLARAGDIPADHAILVNLTGSDRQKTEKVGDQPVDGAHGPGLGGRSGSRTDSTDAGTVEAADVGGIRGVLPSRKSSRRSPPGSKRRHGDSRRASPWIAVIRSSATTPSIATPIGSPAPDRRPLRGRRWLASR